MSTEDAWIDFPNKTISYSPIFDDGSDPLNYGSHFNKICKVVLAHSEDMMKEEVSDIMSASIEITFEDGTKREIDNLTLDVKNDPVQKLILAEASRFLPKEAKHLLNSHISVSGIHYLGLPKKKRTKSRRK